MRALLIERRIIQGMARPDRRGRATHLQKVKEFLIVDRNAFPVGDLGGLQQIES